MKKEGKKKLKLIGKILMFSAPGIFVLIILFFFLIALTSGELTSGEFGPFAIIIISLIIFLSFYGPLFVIGLILYLMSKFLKEESSP